MKDKIIIGVASAVAGILFGSIIEKALFIKNNRFGKLIINETDPEKDIYNLEVNDIAGVSSKKYIVLEVEAQ